MKYRKLGASGLQVSDIALGTTTFGEQNRREQVSLLACSPLAFGLLSGKT